MLTNPRSTRLEVSQGHQTWFYVRYGLLLVCCSKCTVPKTRRFWDIHCNYRLYRDLETRVKITQGHRNRHESIHRLWLPILTFHSNHGPISYSFRERRRCQSKIAKLTIRMHGTTWPVSGGCKIITHLESKTHSFLLTVQLSSGYDDD